MDWTEAPWAEMIQETTTSKIFPKLGNKRWWYSKCSTKAVAMLLGVWIICTKNGNTQEFKLFAANKLNTALGLALVMLRIAPVTVVSG